MSYRCTRGGEWKGYPDNSRGSGRFDLHLSQFVSFNIWKCHLAACLRPPGPAGAKPKTGNLRTCEGLTVVLDGEVEEVGGGVLLAPEHVADVEVVHVRCKASLC